MGRFRVQFNDYDTYQALPLELDQLHNQVAVVPIIRIYGSFSVSENPESLSNGSSSATHGSSTAQLLAALSFTAVVHVHNFYPYIYLDAPIHSIPLNSIEAYLESCLRESFLRQPDNEDEAGANSVPEPARTKAHGEKRRFIARIALCKGTPVYGYQVGSKCMLKVSLLSPTYKTRLVRLIHEKKVQFTNFCSVKEKYKPNLYEAHLPMLLQFLTDYNIYGCGWIDLESCWFRTPVLDFNSPALCFISNSRACQLESHLRQFTTPANVLSARDFPRIGNSILEIDVSIGDIHNRTALGERHLHQDFVERFNFDPKLTAAPIYLTSTLHIVKDLKYQCEVRGKDPVNPENIGKNLGFLSTEWANSSELRKSLDYVISLTGKREESYMEYSESSITDNFTNLPTTFALVDIERTFQLNPRLQRWSNFDSLIRRKLGSLQFLSQLNQYTQSGQQASKSQTNISNASFESLSDALSSSESSPGAQWELDLDDDPDSNGNINAADQDNILIEPSQRIDDEAILQMTQRHSLKRVLDEPPLSPVLQVNSSFTELELRSTPKLHIPGSNGFIYERLQPPALVKENFRDHLDTEGILQVDYCDPFYSKMNDQTKPLIFANKKIDVPLVNDDELPCFAFHNGNASSPSSQIKEYLRSLSLPFSKSVSRFSWQYTKEPPTPQEIRSWVETKKTSASYFTQIEHPNTGTDHFKYSYRLEATSRRPDSSIRLTNFHVEIHVNTEGVLLPDPETNQVTAIFYHYDDANLMFDTSLVSGVLINQNSCKRVHLLKGATDFSVECFEDEHSMLDRLVFLVEAFDPDILCGYEINASSWGYLVERFRSAYDVNLLPLLSRCTFKSNGKFGDRWGYTHTSALKINGRHLLNVWRTLRSGLALTSYSLENVVFHVLHQTMAKYSNEQLSTWLNSDNSGRFFFVLNYYMLRILTIQKIIDTREIITKNVEQARFIGVDFYSVFFRGSQYKVESILSRIAKVESLVLNSPSKLQVSNMKPLEAVPLILEPDSNFYKSPLVVLDFQSLYPSIMIAYNYCFSTLVGRLDGFDPKKNTIGFLKHLEITEGLVNLLNANDDINLSPNGYMFVKSSVRKSLLSKMLEEILNTRIQVKKVMSMFDDKELSKLLNSRQLALKLIANVTYGYASASFSGRMPNSAIADAIVSTGREILTQSIHMIELAKYGARVVYGDTDSLFVYLPGRTKDDAFKIGREIADTITSCFPDPIQLKFEKLYHPCVLLSKKRYAGSCYEYETQVEPTFQAKGIETVRRDGIPAQLKMVEKTLRILFSTKDLSLVKKYTLTQFRKIMLNRISIGDFCFAKEVRHGTYKSLQHVPAGAMVAMRKVERDPRSEPQYKERVPYVVIEDAEKPRIKDRSVPPEEFIEAFKQLRPVKLDYEYYITRVLIPPLERIFNLIGADVRGWYKEIPKQAAIDLNIGVLKLSRHIKSNSCLGCGGELSGSTKNLCDECLAHEQSIMLGSVVKSPTKSQQLSLISKTCYGCVSASYLKGMSVRGLEAHCENHSCEVYFERLKTTVFKSRHDLREQQIKQALEW